MLARVEGELPRVLDSLTFEGFYLEEIEETMLVFHEVTNEVGDVTKTLDFQVVLGEETEEVHSH